MVTIANLISRINEMISRVGKFSIGKTDLFGLLRDMVNRQQAIELNMSNLSIRKIYASVAAMNADVAAPVGDNNENILKGQLVCIDNESDATEMGKVYRYAWTSWEYAGKIGDLSGKQDKAVALISDNQRIKQYDSALTVVGYADTTTATPASVLNAVYIPKENGVIFGQQINDCKGEFLVCLDVSNGYKVEVINQRLGFTELETFRKELEAEFSDTTTNRVFDTWEQGQWYSNAYSPNGAANRIAAIPVRTNGGIKVNVTLDPAYMFNFAYFDVSTKCTFIGGSWLDSFEFTIPDGYYFYSIQLKKVSDAAFIPSEIGSVGLTIVETPFSTGFKAIKEYIYSQISNVSDEVTQIDTSISAFTKPITFEEGQVLTLVESDLVNGAWPTEDTDPIASTTRIAMPVFVESVLGSTVTVSALNSGYNFNYALIDEFGVSKVVGATWLSEGDSFNLGIYSRFALQFRFTDNSVISLSEISNMGFSANYFSEVQLPEIKNVVSNSVKSIFADTNNPFNQEANLLYKKAAVLANINDEVQPLIIIAGQSNADGRELKANAPAWLVSDDYKIPGYKMWNKSSGKFEDYEVGVNDGSYGDTPDRFSFDVYFAHQYLIDNPTKTLYAIRQTVGGIPITELGSDAGSTRLYRWQPRTDLIPSGENSMCEELVSKIKDAITYCYLNSIEIMPIAVLYHQGEGDADRASDGGVTAFPQNIKNLISWFRGLFCTPLLPFINGYIMATYSTDYEDINAIFDNINILDAYSKTVDMTGHYTSIGDGLHYNEAALSYLGGEMYNFYKALNL